MELEIKEKIEKKYQFVKIEVKYLELRKYQINAKIMIENLEFEKEIIYVWDAYFTKDVNINTICNMIDNYILKLYRKDNK